jgi:hypothetical protein
VSKAEAALESARREHEATKTKIEKDRAAIEQRLKAEEARWDKLWGAVPNYSILSSVLARAHRRLTARAMQGPYDLLRSLDG